MNEFHAIKIRLWNDIDYDTWNCINKKFHIHQRISLREEFRNTGWIDGSYTTRIAIETKLINLYNLINTNNE